MHEPPFVTDREPRCVNLPLVHELVDGTLDAASARRIEAHVAVCEPCADEARFVRALRAAAAELPRVVPGDHVWEGIAASLADAGAEDESDGSLEPASDGAATNGTLPRRPRRLPRAGGIAAALVPIVGVALLVGRFGGEHTRRVPVAAGDGTPVRDVASRTTTATDEPATAVSPGPSTLVTGAHDIASPAREQGSQGLTVRPAADVSQPAGESHADGGRAPLDLYGTALALENRPQIAATPAEVDSQVAFDRERLAEAENAIRACNEALARNPDDVRVRAALVEAYDQKVRALRALIAAGEKRRPSMTATPVGYGGNR